MALIRTGGGVNLDTADISYVAGASYNAPVTFNANIGDYFIVTSANTEITVNGGDIIDGVFQTTATYPCSGVTLIKATATSVTVTPASTTWCGLICKISV